MFFVALNKFSPLWHMEIFWPSGGTLGPCVVWHCEEFMRYFVVALIFKVLCGTRGEFWPSGGTLGPYVIWHSLRIFVGMCGTLKV